ncbi:hypothetical protein LCGC14_0988700 [marine sediment metagenome]|uniref:HNH nuclease domain-containing protein n=1 Tax=marine sediment metagenome TaxID=412755 RepID=A0A0F9QPT9_9ZZZZ
MKLTQKSHNSTLRKKSSKQIKLDRIWANVKADQIRYLADKYGQGICEWCGKWGNLDTDDLWGLDAHHMNHDRKVNTPGNCYICHRICHTHIEILRIQVTQEDFQGREYEAKG